MGIMTDRMPRIQSQEISVGNITPNASYGLTTEQTKFDCNSHRIIEE